MLYIVGLNDIDQWICQLVTFLALSGGNLRHQPACVNVSHHTQWRKGIYTLISYSLFTVYKPPGICDWAITIAIYVCIWCCVIHVALLSLFILTGLPTVTPKIAVLLLPLLSTHVLFKLLDGSLLFSTWTPITFAVILHSFVHYLLCYIYRKHAYVRNDMYIAW